MKNLKISFGSIPGWVYTLLLVGFLYGTGLHTEAIGQVQRVLLATGIMRPDLPETSEATNTPTTTAESPGISATAMANDFQLQDLNGNLIPFSSLQNNVIFLNIWATWCPPCVAEMPGIQSLYDKMKGTKNVAFVMLSADQEGLEKVKKFIAKKGYTFPVYLPVGNIPAAFQTQSIPATFIVGKAGEIVAQHNGMADYDTKEMRDFLEKLAAR